MPKPHQEFLSLHDGLQVSAGTAAASLMEKIRRVRSENGPKLVVLADEIGIKSESQLSEAINGKGKNFPVLWLPHFIRYDVDNLIPAEIARWKALRVSPMRPRTAAERLARIERILDRSGAIGDRIREDAEALPESDFPEDVDVEALR